MLGKQLHLGLRCRGKRDLHGEKAVSCRVIIDRLTAPKNLAAAASRIYLWCMVDEQAAPAGWIEAVELGEADAAAGRVVASDLVLKDLRDRAARLRSEDLSAGKQAERAAG